LCLNDVTEWARAIEDDDPISGGLKRLPFCLRHRKLDPAAVGIRSQHIVSSRPQLLGHGRDISRFNTHAVANIVGDPLPGRTGARVAGEGSGGK
jgi:hypothetical protein